MGNGRSEGRKCEGVKEEMLVEEGRRQGDSTGVRQGSEEGGLHEPMK